MAKLIFGCGYLGCRVAQQWLSAGDSVYVVTRKPERAVELAAAGFHPLIGEITQSATLPPLPEVDTILFAVGYDRASGQSIEQVYVDGLKNVLAAIVSPPKHFIYISSTGVFGQVAGDWVDEDSPCSPTRPGGIACLAAERLLQTSQLADRAIILRLAGIYGPQRIPRAADIRAGRPIDAPATGFLNLIHVDDAARIVVAAAQQLSPPGLYVVSDGQPVQRGEYYGELARLLQGPAPTFSEPPVGSPSAARAGSDKRVRPTKLFADMALTLTYPSYRSGLAAIIAADCNT